MLTIRIKKPAFTGASFASLLHVLGGNTQLVQSKPAALRPTSVLTVRVALFAGKGLPLSACVYVCVCACFLVCVFV